MAYQRKEIIKRIEMTCGHFFYYKGQRPADRDFLFCHKCNDYCEIQTEQVGETIDVEEVNFRCERKRSWTYGYCLEEGCSYEAKEPSYSRLRTRMNGHYMRAHTSIGASLQEVPYIPPQEPDF